MWVLWIPSQGSVFRMVDAGVQLTSATHLKAKSHPLIHLIPELRQGVLRPLLPRSHQSPEDQSLVPSRHHEQVYQDRPEILLLNYYRTKRRVGRWRRLGMVHKIGHLDADRQYLREGVDLDVIQKKQSLGTRRHPQGR